MPEKIPDGHSSVSQNYSLGGTGSASATKNGTSGARALNGFSDPSMPPQASVSMPGARSGDFRPRHLLCPTPQTQDLQRPSQTTTFEELAHFNGNPAGFGCTPSMAQCVSVVQKAESWLRDANSSGLMFEAAKQASSKVARFVKTNAEITESPDASLDDKIESKRKCDAGKEVLLAVTTLFTPAKVNEVQSEVIRALDQQQSPAQAAAAISARAFESLQNCTEPEVREAAELAAAGTISIAVKFASQIGTSTPREVADAVNQVVSNYQMDSIVKGLLREVLDDLMRQLFRGWNFPSLTDPSPIDTSPTDMSPTDP